jgi:beta-galactosidase
LTGAAVGLYERSAPELVHRYVRPQENGARCEIRNITLIPTGGDAPLFRVESAGPLFAASLHPWTREELEAAAHVHELTEAGFMTLNLDGAMRGVGGDKPGMLALQPRYRVAAGSRCKLAVRFRIR